MQGFLSAIIYVCRQSAVTECNNLSLEFFLTSSVFLFDCVNLPKGLHLFSMARRSAPRKKIGWRRASRFSNWAKSLTSLLRGVDKRRDWGIHAKMPTRLDRILRSVSPFPPRSCDVWDGNELIIEYRSDHGVTQVLTVSENVEDWGKLVPVLVIWLAQDIISD